MAECLFLRLDNICLSTHTHTHTHTTHTHTHNSHSHSLTLTLFFAQSLFTIHLVHVHIMAVVNNTPVNAKYRDLFKILIFPSAVHPEVGLLDHVNFLRKLYTGFHNGCAIFILTFKRYTRLSFSPHPRQDLFSFVFLMTAILTGVKWHLTVALIYISLISDVEHLFIPLAICISSFEKCLSGSFSHFLIG